MTSGLRTIIYPVKDLARAKTLYSTLLGVAPLNDEPYYVGFRVGDQDIGLDPNGHSQGMTGPIGYWHVDDIKQTLGDAPRRRCGDAARGQGCRWWQADRFREGRRR